MSKYSFEEIKKRLTDIVSRGGEPELSLYMYDKEYMIIAYEDFCTFQRCGVNDGSGEVKYNTLDELYDAETVDNIVLKKDWDDIKDFHCYDFAFYYNKE